MRKIPSNPIGFLNMTDPFHRSRGIVKRFTN